MKELFSIMYEYNGRSIYHSVRKTNPDPRGVKYDLADYVFTQDDSGIELDQTGHVVVCNSDGQTIFEAQSLLALALFLPQMNSDGQFI